MGPLLTFVFVVTLVSFNKYECNKFISECFTKELGKILSQETMSEWSIIQYYGYKRNNFAIF